MNHIAPILALSVLPLSATGQETVIHPPGLALGDTIALVLPASPSDASAEALTEEIESRGFRVRLPDNLGEARGSYAGDDTSRLRAFMDAWLDPEVDGVWCLEGGVGCLRLVAGLDYEAIAAHPKVFIGMSDITALHTAIVARTGLVTFLGPNAGTILRRPPEPPSYSEQWLWRAVMPREPGGYAFEWPSGLQKQPSSPDELASPETIAGGQAEGRLIGGNMTLLTALIGTPYLPDMRGRILVLEDVGESAEAIDDMLCQIELSGTLDEVGGVVLGLWRGCGGPGDDTLTLHQLFEDHLAHRPYPVLLHFPTGHVATQATLPLNALCRLDADARTLTILESPVAAGD